MKPIRIHVQRIFDYGTIVSLVGVDTETDQPVAIHVDHRPLASFWEAWGEAGLPQPIEYAADRLMLHLDLLPDEGADEVRLIEGSATTATAPTDRFSAPEIEP
jgi:hypothetical protein